MNTPLLLLSRAGLLAGLLVASWPAFAVIDLVITGQSRPSLPMVEQQLVDSLSAEEIRARGFTRLEQVLQAQPGLTTRSVGGEGSYSQVGIRGSTARQVAVYVDGVLVNDASGMPVDLSQFDLSMVERIDIYRDLQPVEFSQPIVGGVIHIVTRSAGRDIQWHMSAGSHGSLGSGMSAGWRSGRWRHQLQWEAASADNDYPMLNDNGTGLNPYDDRIEPRRNAGTGSENLQWILRRDRVFDQARSLLAKIQLRQSRQHVPDRNNDPANTAWLGRELRHAVFSLSDEPGTQQWLHRLSLRDERVVYRDLADRVGLDAQDNEYETRRVEWQSRLDRSALPLVGDLSLLLDASREDYRSIQRLGSLNFRPDQADYRRNRWSLALRVARRSADQRLEFVPVLRWSLLHDQGAQARETERDWTMQLGWSLAIGERASLSGLIARFTRAPSFSERFSDHGFTVGNPELRQERTDALSLSYHRRQDSSQTDLSMTGYLRHNRDLIVVSYDARGIGHYENIADSLVAGLEFSLRGSRDDGLDWGLAYAFTGSRIYSDISAYDGGMLPNTPLQTLDFDLSDCLDGACRWRYWYRFHHARNAWYDRANLLPVAEQNIQDIGIDYRRKRWGLRLAINNLSDQPREEFNGFPGPGRTWKVSFNLQL